MVFLKNVGILSIVFPAFLLSACAIEAAETTNTPRPTPRTFNSACDLGDSMASSLRSGPPWAKDKAEQTCKMLQPTMGDEDAVEFLRCCLQRLTAEAPKT